MPTNFDPRGKRPLSRMARRVEKPLPAPRSRMAGRVEKPLTSPSPAGFRSAQAKKAGKDGAEFNAAMDYLRANPKEAMRILSDAFGVTPPWMREKPTKADIANEAKWAAASLIPVPGLGQTAKGIAKAGTKAAEAAAKAAGKAGGKTAAAVAKDAATAASRRTAAESATIAAGTRRGRSAAKAIEMEKQAAKESSSKSVNVGTKSPVAPRAAGAEGPKVPKGAVDKFVKGRKFKNPTQAKKDLEEQLKIGARMRAEGRRPGSDVPNADGKTPIGNPAASASKPAKPKAAAKPTAQEAKADAFAKGLTKPKKPTNPGKAKLDRSPGAKATYEKALAQYEKDLAAYEKRIANMDRRTKLTNEGRLKADGGAPKGATAKSIARNARKKGAEGPKASVKPAAKKPSVKGAEGPKAGSAVAPRTTPKNTPQVIKGEVVKGGRNQREPIDLKVRPINNGASGAGRRAIGGARPGTADAQARRAIAGRAAEGPKKGRKWKIAAGILGGTAAAGLLAKQFDSDKSPKQMDEYMGAEGPKARSPRKPAANTSKAERDYVMDNKGRRISRAEFNRRAEFRKSIGIEPRKDGESLSAYRKRVDEARAKNKAAVKAEEARRAKYRQNGGKKKFGKAAITKTRKRGPGAGLDSRDARAREALR